MAEKRLTEKAANLVRDFNIVTGVGKVAIGTVIPLTAPVMYAWAAWDGVTAAAAHAAGKHFAKKKQQ